MAVDFSRDAGIQKLEIHTNAALEIKSVMGPDLKSISVKGSHKIIKDLCIFTQQARLPNLVQVTIESAELNFFGHHQFQDCLVSRQVINS